MNAKSTLHPDVVSIDYATRIDKVRIFTEPTGLDGQHQWTIDGFDTLALCYTETAVSFDTFAEAVAAIPDFIHGLFEQGIDVLFVLHGGGRS
jgi:hypothetical protein